MSSTENFCIEQPVRIRSHNGITRWTFTILATLLCPFAIAAQPPAMPEGVAFRTLEPSIGLKTRLLGSGALKYRGGIAMQFRDASAGNFSGMHISQSGEKLFAVGRNTALTASLHYAENGNLQSLQLDSISVLKRPDGKPLTTREESDAEALYFDGTGYLIGFEGNNRVWRYPTLTTLPTNVALPEKLTVDVPDWGGYSTVTGKNDGTLMVFTEGGKDFYGDTKGWLWPQGKQPGHQVTLRFDKGWFAVDMAYTPAGDLLILEVATGKSIDGDKPRLDNNRISLVHADQIHADREMQPVEIAMLKPRQFYHKLEAIHARIGPTGETLVYLMSDSGGGWPTELLMFELRD